MPIRWMNEEEAWSFLFASTEGRLGTADLTGQPYVTTVNYVLDGETLYFHSKTSGRKLENIQANPRVCFEVSRVDQLRVDVEKACGCATRYRSVLCFGKARVVESVEEKVRALNLLVSRFAQGRKFAPVEAKHAENCAVVAIRVDEIRGKRNVDPEKAENRD